MDERYISPRAVVQRIQRRLADGQQLIGERGAHAGRTYWLISGDRTEEVQVRDLARRLAVVKAYETLTPPPAITKPKVRRARKPTELVASVVEATATTGATATTEATAPDESDAAGFVYLIRAKTTNRYKIGWAKSPESRVQLLQIGSAVDLILIAYWRGTLLDEQRLHRGLGARRIRGEWFRFDQPEEATRVISFAAANGYRTQDELQAAAVATLNYGT